MCECEICGTKMKLIYKNMRRIEKKEFFYCPNCKLKWAPKLDMDKTFHSKLNESSREKALHNVRNQEFALVNRMISKYVDAGSLGLDVGCSYGWYMDSVGSNYIMEGIEPESSIAEQAKKRGHKVFTGFFPYDIPEDHEKYEFIVYNNVWEHINHTSDLVKGSISKIKNGGILVITIPLSTGGLYRISELFEKAGRTKELVRLWQLRFHSPHIYYFTKKNFEELMKKFNCTLLECRDIKGIDPKKMKERFEMDTDERHGTLKARVFQLAYPILKKLPADKAVFVFRYSGREGK